MDEEQHFGGTRRSCVGDGVTLNVVEAGERGPVVVFVHGYPDTHAVWLSVIARLSGGFRCVAYDVRGAGESTAPASTEGYHVRHLVSDLVAVIDAVSPARPAHLVGHDWGSVQTWESVLLASTDDATARPDRVVHDDQRAEPWATSASGRGVRDTETGAGVRR